MSERSPRSIAISGIVRLSERSSDPVNIGKPCGAARLQQANTRFRRVGALFRHRPRARNIPTTGRIGTMRKTGFDATSADWKSIGEPVKVTLTTEFAHSICGACAVLPILERAALHGDAVAICVGDRDWTYRALLERALQVSRVLLPAEGDLHESRVAVLIAPGADYVAAQWGVWQAGGLFVPLSLSATSQELRHTLEDAQPKCLLVQRDLAERVSDIADELSLPMTYVDDLPVLESSGLAPAEGESAAAQSPIPEVATDRRAMMLYTSGTTSRPKGVVTTHRNIQAQVESLVSAWEWSADDRIPLFLPLHHIHGIINILSCGLWSGARIDVFPRFEMDAVLQRVADRSYTLFMAVPTIYVKLIQTLEALPEADRQPIIDGFAALRLMVSGSAALPASVHQQWTALTGQSLLERYGMTEIGMALSNPYRGDRRPGTVGQPLPGVELRLSSEPAEQGQSTDDNSQADTSGQESGELREIQVRGPTVFLEYWRRPEATAEAFVDGWFRTGDMAVLDDGYVRIMGRSSVDIIKSGGYKLSALEIESVLLEHPTVVEAAVVGLPDDTWGELVAACLVVAADCELTPAALQDWCRDRLSIYKLPRRVEFVAHLPRNAMGKVTKPAVRALLERDGNGGR